MRKSELHEVPAAVQDYIQALGQEPLVITHQGQAIAVLMPLQNADLETVSLSLNPEFIALLQSSKARLKQEGRTSLEDLKAALATETYLEELAQRGSREKYEAVLAKVPDVEPEPYDQLP
jgi:antitoxin (DNA-binding transcriptional repressor) of toxin-antitoxin stability system